MNDADWRLLYPTSAGKDLRRLDPPVRKRVVGALERLIVEYPARTGLVKLKGRSDSRLRVGELRAIVELDEKSRTVRVKRVLPRGRAYDR